MTDSSSEDDSVSLCPDDEADWYTHGQKYVDSKGSIGTPTLDYVHERTTNQSVTDRHL